MLWKKKGKQSQDDSQHPQISLMNKITREVEALNVGEAVIYQLPEFFVFARFLGVELNPTFPKKGKKYILFSYRDITEGKPAGEKQDMNYTNKASDYADWVSNKDTEAWGHIKRFQ